MHAGCMTPSRTQRKSLAQRARARAGRRPAFGVFPFPFTTGTPSTGPSSVEHATPLSAQTRSACSARMRRTSSMASGLSCAECDWCGDDQLRLDAVDVRAVVLDDAVALALGREVARHRDDRVRA